MGKLISTGANLLLGNVTKSLEKPGPAPIVNNLPRKRVRLTNSNYRTRRTRILQQQTPSKPFKFQRRKGALHILAPSYDQKKNRNFKMYFNKIEMSSLGPTPK